jgi:hypothetical protein
MAVASPHRGQGVGKPYQEGMGEMPAMQPQQPQIMGWVVELRRSLDDWSDSEFVVLLKNPSKLDIERIERAYGEIIGLAIERFSLWCSYFSRKPRSDCYEEHYGLGHADIIDRYIYEDDLKELAAKLKKELISRLGREGFNRLVAKVEEDIHLMVRHHMDREKKKEEEIAEILSSEG